MCNNDIYNDNEKILFYWKNICKQNKGHFASSSSNKLLSDYWSHSLNLLPQGGSSGNIIAVVVTQYKSNISTKVAYLEFLVKV